MGSDQPSAGKRRARRFERSREQELSPSELEALQAQMLPDREAMSVLDGSVSVPIDPAAVVDVLAADNPPGED